MNIRDYIGAISRASADQRHQRNFRKIMSGAARLATTHPAELLKTIGGMGRMLDIEQAEIKTWVEPGDIEASESVKKFDVCDLRIWLELAAAAGIDAIPAQSVATLAGDELEVLLGKVQVPEVLRQKISNGMMSSASYDVSIEDAEGILEVIREIEPLKIDPDSEHPGHRALAKMESALDEIPSSWMVRTHLAGSGNLKTLVGCGIMEKADDTATVRPGFEIGGGWIRTGNRRMIDYSDPRFLETAIGGHKSDIHYLARPWAKPARFHEGEDIHRAGTPLAGPGRWPAEWRVFVRSGQVTGVGNYYGWTGTGACPENAWNAIESAAAAQSIIDEAVQRNLVGVFMAQVFLRVKEGIKDKNSKEMQDFNRDWPADQMHATLDFLETEDGILFLEAGPAHQPGGGGHPCAFAGYGIQKSTESDTKHSVSTCEGVAYLTMPGVELGETSTWSQSEVDGYIDSWDAAAEKALQHAPLSGRAQTFLERFEINLDVDDSLDL